MTASRALTGIDHPIIAVRDMTAARAAYERLGFTVAPRGSHLEWGTGNWCIMFPGDYLELRGIIDPNHTHNLAHFLQEREGLTGVAFGTDNAQASYEMLVSRGLRPAPVRQLSRNFELSEGIVTPRFSLCFPDEADTPGLMSVVFCQHLTPELLRQPEWLRHANGSVGVRALTGVVSDLAAAADAHRRIFGEDGINMQNGKLLIQVSDRHSITLLTPDAARVALAGIEMPITQSPAYLCLLTLRVDDLKATSDYLSSCGIDHRLMPEKSIRVSPRDARGVALEFAE